MSQWVGYPIATVYRTRCSKQLPSGRACTVPLVLGDEGRCGEDPCLPRWLCKVKMLSGQRRLVQRNLLSIDKARYLGSLPSKETGRAAGEGAWTIPGRGGPIMTTRSCLGSLPCTDVYLGIFGAVDLSRTDLTGKESNIADRIRPSKLARSIVLLASWFPRCRPRSLQPL